MTGFGRTGKPFGYQHWDLEPDILVGGKGMAGGYAPLGGVFAKEAIGEAIDGAGYGMMFHTFGAHPGACAASAEVLRIMADDGLVERCARMGAVLKAKLTNAFSNHPHVAEVRGLGLLQAIELVADRDKMTPYAEAEQVADRVVASALAGGAFFYGGGTGEFRDAVCMGPPFTVTEEELDVLVETLFNAVNEVTM